MIQKLLHLSLGWKITLVNIFSMGILFLTSLFFIFKQKEEAAYLLYKINPIQLEAELTYAKIMNADSLKLKFNRTLDPKVVNSFVNEISSSEKHLQKLLDLSQSQNEIDHINKLKSQILTYSEDFQTLTTTAIKLGREKTGIIGDFRVKTHNIEEIIKGQKDDQLLVTLLMMRRHEKDFLLRKSSKYVDKMNQRVEVFKEQLKSKRFSSKVKNEIVANLENYHQLFLKVTELSLSILKYEVALESQISNISKDINTIVDNASVIATQKDKHYQEIIARSLQLLLVLTLVFIAISSFLSSNLARRVTKSILESIVNLEKTVRVNNDKSQQLKNEATTLNASSAEQASASHETAASMTEMEAMINKTTEEVDKGQIELRNVSDRTNHSVQQMMELQSSINELIKSNSELEHVREMILSISEKTSIINDIVFKTQLLAFNASIEAARAGEHGRGFAVVAEEISQLANTSGEAAKGIEELISNGVDQVSNVVTTVKDRVDNGQQITSDILNNFNMLQENMNSTIQIMHNITNATSEQKDGIMQTNVAIKQMNTVTDQFSSAASNIAESADIISNSNKNITNSISAIKNVLLGNDKVNTQSKNSSANVVNILKNKKLKSSNINRDAA